MHISRVLALTLALALCMGALAFGQDEAPKRLWVTGRITAVDLENSRVTLKYKDAEVTVPLPDGLHYENWSPGSVEDLQEGYMVGVWCRYKEGDEKIVANGYVVQYGGRAGNRFQIHNYKVDGAYKLVNGGPAVVIDGKDVPFEVGPRARIIIRKQGSKEDLKVGYELHFPSFGLGDTLPPQGYVRYLPPRE